MIKKDIYNYLVSNIATMTTANTWEEQAPKGKASPYYVVRSISDSDEQKHLNSGNGSYKTGTALLQVDGMYTRNTKASAEAWKYAVIDLLGGVHGVTIGTTRIELITASADNLTDDDYIRPTITLEIVYRR